MAGGQARKLEGLLPGPLLPPTVLAASSLEAFPDGTEVFGGLDSKDDAGDRSPLGSTSLPPTPAAHFWLVHPLSHIFSPLTPAHQHFSTDKNLPSEKIPVNPTSRTSYRLVSLLPNIQVFLRHCLHWPSPPPHSH